MDLEAIKALFEDFDVANFLPDLTSLLGWVETLLRLCVMLGPLLIFGLGLLYLLAPPKEANYALGYRFWWSMASLDAWQFTHRLVGWVWSPLGLVLSIIMALICNGFRNLEPMAMVERAAKCIGWELGLILAACIAVDVVVIITFDRMGFRRKDYEG